MYRQGKEEDQEKLENMHELATLALKYDLIAGGLSGGDEIAGGMGLLQPEKNTDYGAGIEELLKDAALQSDQDNIDGADEKNKNAVKLMTIHASKGLEFDYVFITGLEEGLFPHSRASEGKESGSGGGAESEEERRLFYVALTRARKKIYLSHAQMRTIFGSKQVAPQSSFINDVDKVYLEEQEPPSGAKLIFIDF